MPAISTIAYLGIAVAAVGTVASIQQSRQAAKAQREAASRQEGVNAEQDAANTREAALAQRQRIREERVKRAQIIAASESGGTSGSSAEVGALGGMTTQAGAANGASAGMFAQGQRITVMNQGISNLMSQAQSNQNRSQMWGQFASMGYGIFGDARAQGQAGNKTYSLGLGGAK